MIAGDKIQKGLLFESLLVEVLDKQGFGNFSKRKIKTGMEIDIEATNNVTNKKIIVEAKAHEKEVDTSHLRNFHSKVVTEREKREIESGIFWSLSGINAHAKAWYDDLDAKTKSFLIVKDGDDFLRMLQDLQIIEHTSSIENKSKSLIKKDILNTDLVYFKNKWYFIQYCGHSNQKDSFLLLDSHGEIVDNLTCKDIRDLLPNLRNLKLILLSSREQILTLLLQKESITATDIVKELKEQLVDVQTTLDDLVSQNLIISERTDEPKYAIKEGLETFLQITKEFKDKSSILMKSMYLEKSMTYELVSYISKRFFVDLSEEEKRVLVRILLISPSSLEYCLRSDDTPHQNLYEQFKGNLPKKVQQTNLTSLMSKLCILCLNDLENKQLLGLQKTRALSVILNLKISTLDESYLTIDAKYTTVTMQAAGGIKRGEAVKIANPEGFIELSMIHHNLGQTKEAIKLLHDVMNVHNDNGSWRKAAHVNLGLLYHEIGNLEQAMTWLKRATSQYPEVLEGWLNLGNIHLDSNDLDQARKAYNKALQIDSNHIKVRYGLTRILAAEGKEDECYKQLEEILKQEKRFVNRINEDKEFKKIRKNKEYLNLLKKLQLKKKYP